MENRKKQQEIQRWDSRFWVSKMPNYFRTPLKVQSQLKSVYKRIESAPRIKIKGATRQTSLCQMQQRNRCKSRNNSFDNTKIQEKNQDAQSISRLIYTLIDKREVLIEELKAYEIYYTEDEIRGIQERINKQLNDLRIASIQIVEQIKRWRQQLNDSQAVFMWKDQNYLQKMLEDTKFIEKLRFQQKNVVYKPQGAFLMPDLKSKIPMNNVMLSRLRICKSVLSIENAKMTKNINQSSITTQETQQTTKRTQRKRKTFVLQKLQFSSIINQIYSDMFTEYLETLIQPLANRMIFKMIKATLMLFSNNILDNYITIVLEEQIPQIAEISFLEIKDKDYVYSRSQIISEGVHEQLLSAIEDVVQWEISKAIFEDFFSEIPFLDVIDQCIDDENAQLFSIIEGISENIMQELFEQEWFELLIEDLKGSTQLTWLWETLPNNLQHQYYIEQPARVIDLLSDQIIQQWVFDIVGGTWLTGVVQMAIYEEAGILGFTVERAMPTATSEELERRIYRPKPSTKPLFQR